MVRVATSFLATNFVQQDVFHPLLASVYEVLIPTATDSLTCRSAGVAFCFENNQKLSFAMVLSSAT